MHSLVRARNAREHVDSDAGLAGNAALHAAAADDARDRSLVECAEDAVKILIDMRAPACEGLDFTEAA